MITVFILIALTLAFYIFYCSTIHKLTKTVNVITNSSSPVWLCWLIQPVLSIPFLDYFNVAIALFLWWCSHVQFLGMPLKHWAEQANIKDRLFRQIKSFYDNLRGIFFIGIASGIAELLFYATKVYFFKTLMYLLYSAVLMLVLFTLICARELNQDLNQLGVIK